MGVYSGCLFDKWIQTFDCFALYSNNWVTVISDNGTKLSPLQEHFLGVMILKILIRIPQL